MYMPDQSAGTMLIPLTSTEPIRLSTRTTHLPTTTDSQAPWVFCVLVSQHVQVSLPRASCCVCMVNMDTTTYPTRAVSQARPNHPTGAFLFVCIALSYIEVCISCR